MTLEMGSSATVMAGMPTATVSEAVQAAAAASEMSMSMGESCKISMLWNWYTIDACFLSKSWHITSTGMFVGTCIGVVLLVMSLEFLRRMAQEYDGYIIKRHIQVQSVTSVYESPCAVDECMPLDNSREVCPEGLVAAPTTFRPNVLQQATRATFHMTQFAVAYLIMLLAMYYNGYILLCIAIGAWLGAFVFTWQKVSVSGPMKEATVCCG